MTQVVTTPHKETLVSPGLADGDIIGINDASAGYVVKKATMLQVAAHTLATIDPDGLLTTIGAMGSTVTIGIAASATTDGMDITITVKDVTGATVAAAHQLEFWMSESSVGAGLTGDAYSGDLTATTGAILSAHTAKKHWSVATAATGIFAATLVDSANPADQYVACKAPLGAEIIVSEVSGTNWEGAA